MRYVEVSKEEIQNLRPAIQLLERVNHASSSTMADYTIYGLTTNPEILQAAAESVYVDEAEGETPPQFSEVAVAIPVSSDFLYYLTGSGLKVNGLDFAYPGMTQGEGIRTDKFSDAINPRVILDNFAHIAIADGDVWLDDFFNQHVQAQPQHHEVERDEEAVLEAVPSPEPAKGTPAVPRTSNYQGLEDWFHRG
jgi:hypothetical protein